MIALVLLKVLFKVGVVVAKKNTVRKASVLGVIAVTGVDELARKRKFEENSNKRKDFKNNNNNNQLLNE